MELYFQRGMEPAEVARLMNISVKTVYSKKNKIRNRLVAMAQAGPARSAGGLISGCSARPSGRLAC